MLLFHGTTEENLASILQGGLLPPQPGCEGGGSWQKQLSGTGRDALVYLSNRPIAGKGGDPVAFALDWKRQTWGQRRDIAGYIVVVELPREALGCVKVALHNQQVDRFFDRLQTQSCLHRGTNMASLLHLSNYFVSRALAPSQQVLGSMCKVVALGGADSLRRDLDAETWKSFRDAYFRLVLDEFGDWSLEELHRKRRAILARYRVELPAWMEADRIDWRLPFTVESLFQYGYFWEPVSGAHRATGRDGRETLYHLQGFGQPFDRFVIARLPQLLGLLGAWFDTYPHAVLLEYFQHHFLFTWQDFQRQFPPDQAKLPEVWRDDFTDLPLHRNGAVPRNWHREDMQFLCEAIAPRYLVGAIEVCRHRRICKDLRPNRRRGQTLGSLLWKRIYALKRQRKAKGKPVVLRCAT